MRLLSYKSITGTVRCLTGLHIGAAKEQIEIGGVDNPVIKHPFTNDPYIPGSSLKGKMRSELEKNRGLIESKGDPHGQYCGHCLLCKVFGAHKNPKHTLGPTRIIVRDAFITEETKQNYHRLLSERPVVFFETKTETAIDRRSNTARDPRQLERVPAGTEFALEISVQLFDVDNEQEIFDMIKEGLSLVEKSYLGGSGSRGSGQVKFNNLRWDGQEFSL